MPPGGLFTSRSTIFLSDQESKDYPSRQPGPFVPSGAPKPDGSDVTAETKDNVITLTGHVRTWAEHDAVVGAALIARGVVDVRDELQVTG